ncbi:MAG: phenylalanine--tRNA ligase subunit alpha [Candidatus Gracilibacteria bacterium]|jgi:phenylalanyl-tRNA synthetase alpha chain
MQETLKKLQQEAITAIGKADSLERVKEIEVEYLGRNGHLTFILRGMKDLSDEEKRVIGPLCNETKKTLEDAFAKKIKEFEDEQLAKELSKEFFDTTIPSTARPLGHIHPLSQVQEEVERIFSQMGFTVADGPEIESEYYNFEGLNIPKDHPARDMQDTFFIQEKDDEKHLPAGQAGGKMVLRTQTSPVQLRSMEKYGAPLRLIVPGRVFRFEATDASHDSMFYQVEGLLIDKDISLSHLKGVMAEFLTRLFGKPVKVRFRPGYFPFVEPGLEVDFSCLLCEGKGCRVCKHSGWMEFMGAGMVHANVLKAGGIDPKEYQGWAFGFGLTRLVMMRYGIDDIRLLTNGDLRFIKQF